jgi:hypothetical protein
MHLYICRYIPEYNNDSLPSGSEDDLPGSRIGNHSQVSEAIYKPGEPFTDQRSHLHTRGTVHRSAKPFTVQTRGTVHRLAKPFTNQGNRSQEVEGVVLKQRIHSQVGRGWDCLGGRLFSHEPPTIQRWKTSRKAGEHFTGQGNYLQVRGIRGTMHRSGDHSQVSKITSWPGEPFDGRETI